MDLNYRNEENYDAAVLSAIHLLKECLQVNAVDPPVALDALGNILLGLSALVQLPHEGLKQWLGTCAEGYLSVHKEEPWI